MGSKFGRLLIAAAATGAVLAGTAGAAPPAEATGAQMCQGNGSLFINGAVDSGFTWQLQGGGSCSQDAQFPPSPTVVAQFSGGGTSSTLGLCSSSLDVTNLQLNVTVTYTDFTNNRTWSEQQTWSAAASTFPLDTPFTVTTSGGAMGAGVMFSHIFLQCGNDGGKPSANFNWTQTA